MLICDAKLLGAKMDLPNRQLCWPFDTLLAILRQLAFDRVFWDGLKSLSHFVFCFLTYLTYINWICICAFAKNVWKHSSIFFLIRAYIPYFEGVWCCLFPIFSRSLFSGLDVPAVVLPRNWSWNPFASCLEAGTQKDPAVKLCFGCKGSQNQGSVVKVGNS